MRFYCVVSQHLKRICFSLCGFYPIKKTKEFAK